MFLISKRFSFSASHQIGGLAADHPCSRLHGHNYEVELLLEADELSTTGFVRDYRELGAFKTFVDEVLDHKHLNEVFGHDRTTSEVIAQWLYDWAKQRWPEIAAVRISETPKTWAEYRPRPQKQAA